MQISSNYVSLPPYDQVRATIMAGILPFDFDQNSAANLKGEKREFSWFIGFKLPMLLAHPRYGQQRRSRLKFGPTVKLPIYIVTSTPIFLDDV
jgi:hypothetical protein